MSIAPSRKILRDTRRERGLCTVCGSSSVPLGKKRCASCSGKSKEYLSYRDKKCREEFSCRTCGTQENLLQGKLSLSKKIDQSMSNYYCETCYLKRAALRTLGSSSRWLELKELLIKQNYTCSYTGEALVLGINASLDHKYPKARFPQYAKEFDNLEWTTLSVNLMKRDLTRNEFLVLIEEIHLFTKGERQ